MKLLLTGLWLFFLISAFNSANNLFYLVFALFTAFFAAPAVIAGRAASGLGVKLVQRGPVFVSATDRVTAEISNSGSEKFMLEIASAEEERYSFKPARLAYIAAGSCAKVPLEFTFKKRGLTIVGPLRVRSDIPLLMSRKYLEAGGERHFIVFPRTVPVRFSARASEGSRSARKLIFNSDYGEINKFKDYGMSDSPAKINWRHYSVTKTLIVPQNEDHARLESAVMLLLAEDHASGSGPYELAVSAAASLVRCFSEKRMPFKLITVSDRVRIIDSTAAPLEKMLSHLAMLEHNRTVSTARLARAARGALGASAVYAVSSQRFDGLDLLRRFLGERLRRIVITSPAGDGEDVRAGRGGLYLEAGSLEELGGAAL